MSNVTNDKIATDLVNEYPSDERYRLRNAITAALDAAEARGRAAGIEGCIQELVRPEEHDHMDPSARYTNCTACIAIKLRSLLPQQDGVE